MATRPRSWLQAEPTHGPAAGRSGPDSDTHWEKLETKARLQEDHGRSSAPDLEQQDFTSRFIGPTFGPGDRQPDEDFECSLIDRFLKPRPGRDNEPEYASTGSSAGRLASTSTTSRSACRTPARCVCHRLDSSRRSIAIGDCDDRPGSLGSRMAARRGRRPDGHRQGRHSQRSDAGAI